MKLVTAPVFRLIPHIVLLAEVLLFHRRVLFDAGYAIPWDLRYYHLPLAGFIAGAFRNGELPLWDPYTYCGFPFFANVQAQLFYPPTAAAIWISNWTGGGWLLDFLEWQIVLHVFLGGIFAYWLLRRTGLSATAALLGGGIYELGPFFASQTQHLGAMNAGAWLPLAWLSIVSLSREFSRRWLAVLAVSFAMSLLAGFPAASYVVMVSSLLLGVLLAAFRRGSRWLPGWLAAACVWGLLLAAIQFLPTAELAGQSVAKYRGDWLGTGGGLPLQSLMSLIIPDYYSIFDLSRYTGPWQPTFLYLYCGIAGLVLAAVGAGSCRRRPLAAVFAVLTGISLLWMLGDATALGKAVFHLLPDALKVLVYPELAMLAFSLGMAVLAGLGAEFVLKPRGLWLGALLVSLTASDLILTGSGRPMNTASVVKEPGITRESFDGSEEVLARMRALTRQAAPAWRIDTVDDSMNWATAAAVTEVPTATGNDPLALSRFMQVRISFTGGDRWGRYYQVRDLNSPLLDLLNVRYLLSRSPIDRSTLNSAGLAHVASLPGREVYENPGALDRFFLVGRVEKAADPESALSLLRAPAFNPREVAVVEGHTDFTGAPGAPAPRAVKVLAYLPSRVLLETDSETESWLVSSETWYPGWRAWIDGRPAPIFITNAAFRGLKVPAGRRRIEMRFEPPILKWGAVVSAASWAALMCFVLAGSRRPGRRKEA